VGTLDHPHNSLTKSRPYYIWLGRSRSADVSAFCHAFEIEGGNKISDGTPLLDPPPYEEAELIPPLDIGEPTVAVALGKKGWDTDIRLPFSSFHYQLMHVS
jgi:betaine lipid synthase